jgi:hypothetical protein
MGKITIRERVDNWLSRASTAYTLWPLVPVGIVSGAVAYSSASVEWINQFGNFGWSIVAIVTFFVLSLTLLLVAYAREKWTYAKIAREKAAPSDAVNPIDSEFTKRRIRLVDLVRPSTQYIRKKTFTDCQLLGPMMVSPTRSEFSGVTFINCNWVVAKPGRVYNVIKLEEIKVRGGDMSDLTIVVSEGDLEMIRSLDISPMNRTGDEEIDSRQNEGGRRKLGQHR